MTVFSSPRKLYLVPQNRHQRVISAVTRLMDHQKSNYDQHHRAGEQLAGPHFHGFPKIL